MLTPKGGLPLWVLPAPFLPGYAEHFRDEFEDVYTDPLVPSDTGTATRGARVVVAVVWEEAKATSRWKKVAPRSYAKAQPIC